MVHHPDAAPNHSLMTTIRYRRRTSDAKRRFDGPSLSTLESHSLEKRIEPSLKNIPACFGQYSVTNISQQSRQTKASPSAHSMIFAKAFLVLAF